MGYRLTAPALCLGVTGCVEILLVHLAASAWRSLSTPPPDTLPVDRAGELLSAAVVLAATAACSHWCLVLVVTALADCTGYLAGVRVAPRSWQAAAAACLGIAIAAVPGVAVVADTGAGATRLDGLRLPDRPVGALAPPAPGPPNAGPTVTVAQGDSLWALAAARLPPSAADARVDSAWRAWYAANRRVIGPDPDLLIPGQRLVAAHFPEGTAE